MCWWCLDMDSSRCVSRELPEPVLELFFLELLVSESISLSKVSICVFISSMAFIIHSFASSLAFSLGSFATRAAARPSLENAFVLVSFSITLNRSISTSIRRRASKSGFLSFTSLDAAHCFTWSRKRCSFLISFFKSDYFARRGRSSKTRGCFFGRAKSRVGGRSTR